jgi:hypothetical protein
MIGEVSAWASSPQRRPKLSPVIDILTVAALAWGQGARQHVNFAVVCGETRLDRERHRAEEE